MKHFAAELRSRTLGITSRIQSWLSGRPLPEKSTDARVDADVDSLFCEFADQAYYTARQIERSGGEDAPHWQAVAVEIARRSGRSVGLDTATRILD